MSVDVGLKQLKGISRGEDGGRESVPVSGGHRDKRVGDSAPSIFIQFDSEGVFLVKTALGGIIEARPLPHCLWPAERASKCINYPQI